MVSTSSYKLKIVHTNKTLDETVAIYRKALAFVVPIVYTHYPELEPLTLKETYNHIEGLIHTTKNNQAVYNFDGLYYKFPSYLRRSVIADALGIVSS